MLDRVKLHERRVAAPWWSVWEEGYEVLGKVSLAQANDFVRKNPRRELCIQRSPSWNEPPQPCDAA